MDGTVLISILGAPVWRLERAGQETVLFANTDAPLSPVDEALAIRIADYHFAPDAAIESIQLLSAPPSEYAPSGPVWQVIFDNPENTRLYVDPQSGQVRACKSEIWRLFDVFWRLNVMDGSDGEDSNHPLLICAALLDLLVTISGLGVLFLRMRRSL